MLRLSAFSSRINGLSWIELSKQNHLQNIRDFEESIVMRFTFLCVKLFYIDFRQTQDVIFWAHTQQLEESKSKAQDPK